MAAQHPLETLFSSSSTDFNIFAFFSDEDTLNKATGAAKPAYFHFLVTRYFCASLHCPISK